MAPDQAAAGVAPPTAEVPGAFCPPRPTSTPPGGSAGPVARRQCMRPDRNRAGIHRTRTRRQFAPSLDSRFAPGDHLGHGPAVTVGCLGPQLQRSGLHQPPQAGGCFGPRRPLGGFRGVDADQPDGHRLAIAAPHPDGVPIANTDQLNRSAHKRATGGRGRGRGAAGATAGAISRGGLLLLLWPPPRDAGGR